MYRKCIHKFPPCYDIKYSTKFWNVTTYTKPCCKKCIALFCNYILSIIQAPTSATPYTLPITSNQKLLTILVTRSILNCLCWCSASLLYTANSCCYIRISLMFSINCPRWFSGSVLYTTNSYCYIRISLMISINCPRLYSVSVLYIANSCFYIRISVMFSINCPCWFSGSVLYIANHYCYIRFLWCFSINCPCSYSVSALYTVNYYCYIIFSLMYLKELPVLMFWFRIVYCKMLLLYNNFSHVSKETAHVFVIYPCHILNIAVTKNCSLFWLLLHIKLPLLMFWFYSVYCKMLLLQ